MQKVEIKFWFWFCTTKTCTQVLLLALQENALSGILLLSPEKNFFFNFGFTLSESALRYHSCIQKITCGAINFFQLLQLWINTIKCVQIFIHD